MALPTSHFDHPFSLPLARTRWLALTAASLLFTACGGDDDGNAGGGSSAGDGDGNSGDGDGSPGDGDTSAPAPGPSAEGWQTDDRRTQAAACSSGDEADFAGLSQITVGGTTLYAGYEQVSGNNQDPVFARFDDGQKIYCKYHEDDGPDGRALALSWDGGEVAYVVYTVVGGGTDLEGKGGWLSSYAPGALNGGNKTVSVLGKVDVESGDLDTASFFMAKLMDGGVNSQGPVDEELGIDPVTVRDDGNVEFRGSSAHKPIDADGKTEMDCTDYPFTTRYVLSPDLSTLVCADSTNCASQKPCE